MEQGVRLGSIQGVLTGCQGVLGGRWGVFSYQKRLRLS
jgi:hypothetical protein